MSSTIVTGAAGALGAALLRRFSKDGHAIGAIDIPEAGDRLRALAAELGPTVVPIAMDVTSRTDWRRALADVERAIGSPGRAVLAAGGWQGGTPLHAGKDGAVWDAMLRLNLETAHQSLGALLESMVARKKGSVVVLGSRAVARPWTSAGASAYAASKAAVVALAESAAAEVIDSGVRINAVLPSVIDTPANRKAMPDADPARWVSTDSLAGVIEFLLSDAARDITGAAIPVYGRV